MSTRRHFTPVPPLPAGLKGRCPRCGQGPLFNGFLATAPSCAACGLDYKFIDAGDGPAVFIILAVGFLVVGLALYTEVAYAPPLWVHALVWLPLTLILSLGTLRPLKGLFVALQYKHKAAEARVELPASTSAPE